MQLFGFCRDKKPRLSETAESAAAPQAYETCCQCRNLWHHLPKAVVIWIDKTAPPSLLPITIVTAVAAPSG